MTNGNDSVCGTQTLGDEIEIDGMPHNRIDLTQPLTKREHFAAMAMQGILACQHNAHYEHGDLFAVKAVRQADLLIEALNQKNR